MRFFLKRRILSALTLGVLIAAGLYYVSPLIKTSWKEQQLTCKGCNVILISVDTLGAKHTSVYNETLDTTPFLKTFADERGIVFEEAFVQAPWTLPSHAAMLTGEYPWDLNVWLGIDALPEHAHTLSEELKDGGYHTAAFSIGGFVQPQWNFDQGFNEFYGTLGSESDWQDLPGLTQDALVWIEEYDKEEPYFLFLRPFHVHDPYGNPENPESIQIANIVDANLKPGGPTLDDATRFQNAYREEVREMDAAFEEFFTTLESAGELENTIIILTSDHGEEFGEHGTVGFHSFTLHRELIHVPLIVFTPHAVPDRISQSVEIRSIPRTTLDLIKASENEFPGSSLLPYMTGRTKNNMRAESQTLIARDVTLPQLVEGYKTVHTLVPEERVVAPTLPPQRSVVEGMWHVIQNTDGSFELYNMRNDPEEIHNIVTDPHTLPSLVN